MGSYLTHNNGNSFGRENDKLKSTQGTFYLILHLRRKSSCPFNCAGSLVPPRVDRRSHSAAVPLLNCVAMKGQLYVPRKSQRRTAKLEWKRKWAKHNDKALNLCLASLEGFLTRRLLTLHSNS
jgi:hypothetical protein